MLRAMVSLDKIEISTICRYRVFATTIGVGLDKIEISTICRYLKIHYKDINV